MVIPTAPQYQAQGVCVHRSLGPAFRCCVAVFVPFSMQGGEAVQATLEQIDVVHKLCEKYPETFEFASSAAEAKRIFGEHSAHRCAILLRDAGTN